MPESELPSCVMGRILEISSAEKSADSMRASRERIQLTLPRSVLISPLWARVRNGCASGQVGSVFVEKRLWMSARADSKDSSPRSGK